MTAPSTTASGGPAAAGSGTPEFDSTRAWKLNPSVALRPEPFGALLYHFGTRKLSFLKNLVVVGVVQQLADHPSADAAMAANGIAEAERPLYLQALSALSVSGMIVEVTPEAAAPAPTQE
ncbi:mycofactocin biosynthesis chaperone MftB [Gordonia sp. (in: high G+C Gram-positive bacteria)]|uniref:mycofactocin biosynthesis chaperone MftB n=1 Tax=Gordonia sp. (in: high G+C Gram-positive bacteria) TaxID=84139 RepID=UPI00168E0A31|nr:mycofactocin biosynthesis chaperone MftB [Gordonia sp. (in: high G+C Gram-positive bacteria)]NLG48110.1 mycofactocin biosynthesis chaperone MftB [Gordonia sp. (in: high G+C Gram-positive bacteria)]